MWWHKKRRRVFERPLAEPLEPRILYAADLAGALMLAGAADAACAAVEQRVLDAAGDYAATPTTATTAAMPSTAALDTNAGRTDAKVDLGASAGAEQPVQRRELVFVDTGVPDVATLIDGLNGEKAAGRPLEIVEIGADVDGIALIGQMLAGQSDIAAIHLISHGSQGEVRLGSTTLDGAILAQRASEIAGWGRALAGGADLLIYGCDVAAGSDGTGLVRDLAALTGADVAASTNPTGAAVLGGDWKLEFSTGRIEAAQALDAATQAAWAGVLATYTADPTKADGASGSLRWAISQANTNAGADTVQLLAGTHNITLANPGGISEDANATGDLDVQDSTSFVGSTGNAGDTVINATAGAADRVFHLLGGNASFSNLTIQGGSNVSQGGGLLVGGTATASMTNVVVQNNAANNGAGIYNAGSLTMSQTEFGGNVASVSGGAIRNQGTLTASDAWLHDNQAKSGGGLYTQNGGAAVTLTDVTISDNSVTQQGGGIYASGGSLSATNLTISGNSAGTNGGGLFAGGLGYSIADATIANNAAAVGGGIYSNLGPPVAQVSLTNTILAANTGGNSNVAQISQGYNIDTDNSAGLNVATDLHPTVSALALAPLAANGGFAPTLALQAGSIAINAGDPAAPATDARGMARAGIADIGAYEYVGGVITVTTAADLVDGDVGSLAALMANKGSDGKISLREAIIAANNSANAGAEPDRILFAIGSGGAQTINIASGGLPDITDAAVIDATSQSGYAGAPLIQLNGSLAGGGADGLSISAGNSTVRGLVISAFGKNGISLKSAGGNVIQGNYIGTNTAGTAAQANNGDGIYIESGNNLIGGSSASTRNIVSGNNWVGIEMIGSGASGNQILGNYVGLNAAGTSGIGNGNDGIDVASGASNTVIGGTAAGAGNVISGSSTASMDGIWISGSTATVIQGNKIGTDAAGSVAIPNARSGVYISGSSDTLVGGSAAGAGNLIANSGASGVTVVGSASQRNAILGNSIYANTSLGIDLGGNGVSANNGNKPPGQPNSGMDFPVFTGATLNGATLSVAGYVGSAPGQALFAGARVEMFVSAADPSGYGEGQTYLGTLTTNASGNFSGSLAVSGVSVGSKITATATDAAGNTSEFGLNRTVGGALMVTTTADVSDGNTSSVAALLASQGADGKISLREAITAANNTAGLDSIGFNLADSDPGHIYYRNDGVAGSLSLVATTALADAAIVDFDPDYPYAAHSWFRIDLNPALAELTLTDAVVIDGYTQAGASANTLVTGDNANIRIELTNTGADNNRGLVLNTGASGSNISGLAINRFTWAGIMIEPGAGANTVSGNFIGTDITGTVALGNGDDGVQIRTSGNVIGGTTPGARNILSGDANRGLGIFTFSGTSTGNLIQNNYIGTDATGTKALANAFQGISAYNLASSSIIGNLISGNAADGIWFRTATATGNTVQGNWIGTDASGSAPLGNGGAGILLNNSANQNSIGGIGAGQGNTIAYNSGAGVNVQSATQVTVRGNAIFGNGALGIDLAGNGVTANDSLDPDTGANNLQNFPVLTSALVGAGQFTVAGTLNSTPGATFNIDFYSSPSKDASGYGEGKVYLGGASITADASGNASISTTLGTNVNAGDWISATATDAAGNTSEFGVAIANVSTGLLWFTSAGPETTPAGGATWNPGQVLEYGDAGDRFDLNGGLTSGTINLLAGFTAPVPLSAMHYVGTTITIGTTGNRFTLDPGDLLLAMDPGKAPATVTLNAGDANPANDIVAERQDIVVYRPTVPGDYATGEYFMLLDNGVKNGATSYNVHALALVETDTMVGGTLLSAGTFVVAHSNPTMHNSIYTFNVTGTGTGAATQTTDAVKLIDGAALGLAPSGDMINDLHLFSQPTAFNGTVLPAGDLLVCVDGFDTYAGVAVTPFDIVDLHVTRTELNGGTAGTGQMLFQGADLGLTDAATTKNISGLTVVSGAATYSPAPVNAAPAGAGKTITTFEDTPYVFSAADFGFTDPNNTPSNNLRAVMVATLPVAGGLTLSGTPVGAGQSVSALDINAGNLRFTPAANANGAGYASFNFKVQDDGGTANGGVDLDPIARTLTINVTAVNDAPLNTVPGAQIGAANAPLVFSTAIGNRITVADVDAGSNPLQVTLTAANGTLSLSSIAGLAFSTGSGSGDASMTFNGASADINAALEGLRFDPTPGYAGSTTLSMVSNDLGNSGSGGAKSNARVIVVNVSFTNSAPILAGANNLLLTLEDANIDPGTPVSGLIAGHVSDADAAALQGIAVTAVDNSHGTWQYSSDSGATWNAFGSPSDAVARLLSADAGSFVRFKPNADWNGSVTSGLSFRAWDQTAGAAGDVADTTASGGTTAFSSAVASAGINVLGINDAPAGGDTTVTIIEDSAYTFGAADFGFTDAHDSPANALLAVRIATLPGAGTLTDNGAALAAGDFVSAADIAAGRLVFTPTLNANGTAYAAFTFQVRDDGGTANGGINLDASPHTMTIDVAAVNDAPAISGLGSAITEAIVNATTAGRQSAPAVAMDGSGDYVVVWTSDGGQDGNGKGIFARRFDSAGNPRGAQFQVNTYFAGDQTQAAVGVAPAGGLVVVWTSNGQDGDATGVYGQRFDAAGNTDGGEFRVNVTTAGREEQPAIAVAADGSFVVAWRGENGAAKGDIFVRRYDAAGIALGGEVRANSTVTDDQSQPGVAIDAAGNFVVAWKARDNASGGGKGISAQRFDNTGAPLGTEFQVNTFSAGDQDKPSVAMAADGRFVVAWSSDGQDGSHRGIYAQLYAAAGTPAGGEFRVNTATADSQDLSAVAMDGAGNFSIAWASNKQDGSGKGIYAQRYDATGAALGGEYRVNATAAGNQDVPAAAMTGGAMVVVWEGSGAGDGSGVFMQLDHAIDWMNEDGTLVFSAANGNAISVADPDAPAGMLRATLSASDGAITLASTAGLAFSAGDGSADASMTFTGTLAAINTALDGLGFASAPDFNGRTTLNLTIDDQGNTGSGGALTASAAIAINVGAVNDAPRGSGTMVTTPQGTAYIFASADFGFTDPADSPANDLLNVRIAALPAAGNLQFAGVGVTAGQLIPAAGIAAGSLQFIAPANASGAPFAGFTFQAQDDGGTANGGSDLDATPRSMLIAVSAPAAAPAALAAPAAPAVVANGGAAATTAAPGAAADGGIAPATTSLPAAPAGASPPAPPPGAPAAATAPASATGAAGTPASGSAAGSAATGGSPGADAGFAPLSLARPADGTTTGAASPTDAGLRPAGTLSGERRAFGFESVTLIDGIITSGARSEGNKAMFEQFLTSLRSQGFIDELDRLREDARHEFDLEKSFAVTATGVTFGISVAYVLWLVRSGVLMGSLLSSLPAWRVLDPLPVLAREGEDDSEDDDFDDAPAEESERALDALRGY